MVSDEAARDKTAPPTMRELRDKGMPKPYRDRRKRSKYTKSVNVPYFAHFICFWWSRRSFELVRWVLTVKPYNNMLESL
jgi:hypothetical protein